MIEYIRGNPETVSRGLKLQTRHVAGVQGEMGTNQRILRGHLHVITVAVLHSSGIRCAKHLAPVLLICFLVKVSAFVDFVALPLPAC